MERTINLRTDAVKMTSVISYLIVKWFFLQEIRPSLCILPSSFESALR
jgi:hypothetical protein